jgi:concentrative nucleoside transporter, CNT family
MLLRLLSLFGIFAFIGIAWALSTNRSRFPWRVVIGGLLLQLSLAVFMLKTSLGQWLFGEVNQIVTRLMSFVEAGSGFLFTIRHSTDGTPPVANTGLLTTFAFGVLPTIIFFSTLMAVLYHIGIMQILVKSIAWVMQKTLKTSGPETLSAAANIFVGHTEAPLVVKPYLSKMTRSELNALMTGGFATVTGSLLGAYSQMGVSAGDLLTACVISAPAALMIAKLMVPETEPEKTMQTVQLELPKTSSNLIGAATQGAADGLQLALNVGAMLIAFLALIAMCDWIFGQAGTWVGFIDEKGNATLTLSGALSYLFWPLAFLMGVESGECLLAGRLLGIKMIANEFIAYDQLGQMVKAEGGPQLSERTIRIMTYALCGFSNFGAIGIQVGGIGGLAPDRKNEIAQLGLRAMIGGTIACLMTGCIAGLFL